MGVICGTASLSESLWGHDWLQSMVLSLPCGMTGCNHGAFRSVWQAARDLAAYQAEEARRRKSIEVRRTGLANT
jgi:hypothetical protein